MLWWPFRFSNYWDGLFLPIFFIVLGDLVLPTPKTFKTSGAVSNELKTLMNSKTLYNFEVHNDRYSPSTDKHMGSRFLCFHLEDFCCLGYCSMLCVHPKIQFYCAQCSVNHYSCVSLPNAQTKMLRDSLGISANK